MKKTKYPGIIKQINSPSKKLPNITEKELQSFFNELEKKQKESNFTAHDFHDIINRISEGKPTKEKPFYFLKGNMRFDGKEIGAVAIKNDSEFLYVKTSDDTEFKKIDHEEFHNNNIKYID